jgi:hypothetical protein
MINCRSAADRISKHHFDHSFIGSIFPQFAELLQKRRCFGTP